MTVRYRSLALGMALWAAAVAVQAAEALQFRPLHARDVPALLQTPQARPRIVEIWSLDCSYCRENIAPFKAPRIVRFLPELPRTETGKIKRGALRELAKQEQL